MDKILWFQKQGPADLERKTKVDAPRWSRYLREIDPEEPFLSTINQAARDLGMLPGELADAINLKRQSGYAIAKRPSRKIAWFQALGVGELQQITEIQSPRWCRYLRGVQYQEPRLDTINQAAIRLNMAPGELVDAINLRRTRAQMKHASYLGIIISCVSEQEAAV